MFSYIDKVFVKKLQLMIEAKLIGSETYIAWCDNLILQTQSPPSWLTELSLEKNSGKAVGILGEYIYSEPFEAVESQVVDFYIACLFIRYRQNKAFSWQEFLQQAGQYSDNNESASQKDCEYYFDLLSKFAQNKLLEKDQATEVQTLLIKALDQVEMMLQLLQPRFHS